MSIPAVEYYDQLDMALEGEVVVDIGQVGPLSTKVLNRAVRAGKLVKWRGRWYPHSGSAYGIGPLKTCWSTPETRELIRQLDECKSRCGALVAA